MASRTSGLGIKAYPLLAEADAMLQAGKFDAAARVTMDHLRQHPDEPRGLAQLGAIAVQLGALGQAEHFLRLALRHGSVDRDVRRNLASTLNQQERLVDAKTLFEELIHELDEPMLRAVLAGILDKLGQTEAALAMRRQLAEEVDDNPHYQIALGHSLRAAGQVDEAVAAYRRAASIDFECGEAWWGLASIKSPIITEEDMAGMRRAIAIAIDVRNSAPTHFALARALHDRGEYAAAFEHYSIGNRERADSIGYDARELTAEVDEVVRSVDSAFVSRLPAPPTDGDVPIFVISLPRSGSTLLEQMLGSHADIEPSGELPYIPAILRSVMELATRRGPVTVPQLVAGMSEQQASALGQEYLRRAKWHRQSDSRYFVDKLPHNWSNILFIRKILPQARFIDIRRPALDCCFSNFTQSFSSAHASSFVLEDIARCYVDYTHMLGHLASVAPGLVHHIAYDRLIDDPETELKAALAYLDLPWDPTVLGFHKLDRVVRTPSSEQVRRPLNRDGVDVWKPYAAWLGPLQTALGDLANS